MRFRAPANVLLRRAQLTLMLVTLVPTVLSTGVGIVLLAVGAGTGVLPLVSGVLVLAFATTAISGYILGSIFVSRGASVARFQNDFFSLVSHELRTPLTSIRLFIESLRNQKLTDPVERERCLALLEREVVRLQDMVERLLSLSRLEANRAALVAEDLELTLLFDDAVDKLQAAAVPRTADVSVQCEPGLAVTGDRAAMANAIGNLLVNAWKHGGGGTIELRGQRHGRHALIEVSDQGPGIEMADQRRVFEYFQRGRAEAGELAEGTGLGLALVRAIVRAHRGSVELSSVPGRGSTFRIKLKATKTRE